MYATIDVQWAPHAWFPQPSTEQEKVAYLDLMKALIAKGANVNAKLGKKIWFRSFTHDYTWVDPAGATAFWRAAQSSELPPCTCWSSRRRSQDRFQCRATRR